jgi:two-component system phosphate regulon response regulator PhoB
MKTDFDLLEAEDGRSLWQVLDTHKPDLILMDWMLPDTDGIRLTKRLKQEELFAEIPIIMLTARSEESDKVLGLDAGADDYIVKPFSPNELLARIRAVLRRSEKQNKSNEVVFDTLVMNVASHQVMANDKVVELGPKEYRLLKYFMEKPGRVFSRSQLMDRVWGRNTYIEERTVDVHIGRLRKILSRYGYDGVIQTVRGAGYRLSQKTNS